MATTVRLSVFGPTPPMTSPSDPAASRPVAPPPGVHLSRASVDDIEEIAALIAATELDRLGVATFRPEDLRTRWLGVVNNDDTLLVRDEDGRLLAYAEFQSDSDPDAVDPDLFVDGRVAPDATGRGLASFLLDRALQRAARIARSTGGRALLETVVNDQDDEARAFFTRRGFTPYRHMLDLRLDLDGELPAPNDLLDITIRSLGADDLAPGSPTLRAVWEAHQQGFADVPTHMPLELEDFVRTRIDDDPRLEPSLWLTASTREGEIVGIVVARVGSTGAAEAGWIRDLAVVPRFRRHGVAMAMLRTTFLAFRDRGCSAVQLEVDDVSLDGAVALYRRAGMQIIARTDLVARIVEA